MPLSKFFTLLFLVLIISSCKDNGEETPSTCVGDFDLESMFINTADNIIIPNYESLLFHLEELERRMNEFSNLPNATNIMSLRSAFLGTYLRWQWVAQYEFGPAEEVFLRNTLNNFPLNVEETEQTILQSGFSESRPDEYVSGLPALDYLLFGVAEDQASILDFYINNGDSENYISYAKSIITEMKTKTQTVLNKWQTSYRNEFTKNTGTAAGTSLSLLINGLNQNYELIKREKIGVPSGVLTLEIPNPENAEAFYSDYSVSLAIVALEATQDLYFGTSSAGAEGIGFAELLKSVNAQKNDQLLDDIIKAQFRTAINVLKDLDLQGTMTEIIETDQTALVNAYNEISKQLVNIKTDMPSVLCVSITYIDNPSDSD